jgi:3-oxoacyl-[acyl-carrier protein] reductase
MAGWDRVFAVNVRGLFQVTRACVPMLREAPSAAIVNLASIAGLRPARSRSRTRRPRRRWPT